MSSLIEAKYFWLLSELLGSLGFLSALVLLAHLLKKQRSPASTIAWLLTIILLPYIGVPLFLMFGGRKMRRRAERKEPVYHVPSNAATGRVERGIERILLSHGVPPATANNAVALVETGEEAYRQLIALIDAAERTIHITTYILGPDEVGQAIVEHLARRAREGVEVRLLLDDYGSWRVGRRILALLSEAGAKVAFFMPVFHIPFRGRANLRNHRKIVVVDGRTAMVGGMNLARSYMGPTPDPKRWRDLSLLIEGPAALDLSGLFRSDWKFATGEELTPDHPEPHPQQSAGETPVQVVASGPDVSGDPLYESLLVASFSAQQRIWVVTPYFVPDETLARALELAARRGLDVRLIVPAHSNHLLADLARGSYVRQIEEAGGQVLRFRPVMLHAKVMVVDDELAVIGTANMDMRSLFLNYEVALFLYSTLQVEETTAWIETLMRGCKRGVPRRTWARELGEDVARLLSPLL